MLITVEKELFVDPEQIAMVKRYSEEVATNQKRVYHMSDSGKKLRSIILLRTGDVILSTVTPDKIIAALRGEEQ